MACHQRIPASLQQIFIQSNKGGEVYEPPADCLGERKFVSDTVYESHKKQYIASADHLLKKKYKQQDMPVHSSLSGRATKSSDEEKSDHEISVQEYFDMKIAERGYKIDRYETLKTGYYCRATQLQMESYGPRMIAIVKTANAAALRECMAAGLSPNPCNSFGESLVHMACRRGNIQLLEIFIEAGACLHVSDDYGRTPLHDAFWAAHPAFEVVSTLLRKDKTMLFMKDCRGSLPMSYIHKDDWKLWRDWLDENIEKFFPSEESAYFEPSDLVLDEPNTWPVPDCKSEFSRELVVMIAKGDLTPNEARLLADTNDSAPDDASTMVGTVAETEYDSDSDSECDSDSDSDDESEYAEEYMEMMSMSRILKNSARRWEG